MSMFVSDEKVAVTIDGVDIIYIRPKMGMGTIERLRGALAKNVTQNAGGGIDVELDISRANIMLLTANIVDWEGPSFTDAVGRKIPCIPQNIERLDPDEPLYEKVGDEIAARNPRKNVEALAPANGSGGNGAISPNLPSVNGGRKSSRGGSQRKAQAHLTSTSH